MRIREEKWRGSLRDGGGDSVLHVVIVASEKRLLGKCFTCGEGSFWEGCGGDSVLHVVRVDSEKGVVGTVSYMWWE